MGVVACTPTFVCEGALRVEGPRAGSVACAPHIYVRGNPGHGAGVPQVDVVACTPRVYV